MSPTPDVKISVDDDPSRPRVRVLVGLRAGKVGRIVERRQESFPVVKSGLVFDGPTGFVGRARGPVEFVVEFSDGERESFHPNELEGWSGS